ncbi:MAG: TetR/AcrR family transcriptional regulator [Anaerolineae bacterium]
MARRRNEELNEAMAQEIKTVARRLMTEEGTNGLSIRGIAKVLEMTPPAIYHYFPSLDDLITALIVDSFNALADTLEAAQAQSAAATAGGKLLDVMLAYRWWAVEHPVDFQLVYGNPIPGYVAPREVTVPAVVRTFVVAVSLTEQAIQSGELVPSPPYNYIPPVIEDRLKELIGAGQYPISTLSMYLVFVLWTQVHGIIYLEIYNHIQSNVADVELFYRTQVHNMLLTMGMHMTG